MLMKGPEGQGGQEPNEQKDSGGRNFAASMTFLSLEACAFENGVNPVYALSIALAASGLAAIITR